MLSHNVVTWSPSSVAFTILLKRSIINIDKARPTVFVEFAILKPTYSHWELDCCSECQASLRGRLNHRLEHPPRIRDLRIETLRHCGFCINSANKARFHCETADNNENFRLRIRHFSPLYDNDLFPINNRYRWYWAVLHNRSI